MSFGGGFLGHPSLAAPHGWSCGYQTLHLCDELANQRGSLDDVVVTPLPKGFTKDSLRIINADRSVRVPGTIPDNGWEEEVTCWKPRVPAPPTPPLLFDEEENYEDVPQDEKSVKGNVKAPPQTPQSTSSSNPPPTSDDARPYVFICGKLFEVPEAYPKGTEGRLLNDKRFIQKLDKLLAKEIRNACARNTNPREKPKASDTKSDLIYKRVFADFL